MGHGTNIIQLLIFCLSGKGQRDHSASQLKVDSGWVNPDGRLGFVLKEKGKGRLTTRNC